MNHIHRKGGVLFAALLCSTAAQAQVTPEQVWTNWQTLGSSYGQTLTAASETRQGETLVVSGVDINSTFEDGSMTGRIETINFRDLGNGTVEVTMSPDYPLVVNTTDSDGKPSVINVAIRQPDLSIIAAGTPTDTRYDFTAPMVKVAVNDVTVDGKPMEIDLVVDITTLAGNYTVATGALTTLASTLSADSAALTLAMTDPESGGTANIKANVTQLAGTSNGTLMDMEAMGDMAAALKAGFATDGTFTYGASSMDFDFVDAGETTTGTATLGSGDIAFALNEERLNYGGGGKDVEIKVSGSSIPFPELAVSYGEAAFNLLMPVSKTDVPGDFALLTRLVDFTISDEVWAMFDPGSVLPREPATVIIDTKGKANWLVDIMDPAQTEALGEDEVPGQLHALDIDALTISAVGADLTGTGAFTFDNSDTTTFPGMPLPTGKLDLKLVGGNALLDRLVQMGLLPEDQAMGARMMMGLFARAVEGAEDTLTSTLEFKDGGFFANGQRLQ